MVLPLTVVLFELRITLQVLVVLPLTVVPFEL